MLMCGVISMACKPVHVHADENILPPNNNARLFWMAVCAIGITGVVLITIFVFVKP